MPEDPAAIKMEAIMAARKRAKGAGAKRRQTVRLNGKFRRNKILDIAAEMIVKDGYDQFTLRRLAERTNIRAASVYYYFPAKADIVEEILDVAVNALFNESRQRIRKLGNDAGFFEKLEVAVDVRTSFISSPFATYMHVYDHLPPENKKKYRSTRNKYLKYWFDLFEEGVKSKEVDPSVDVHLVVRFLIGSLKRTPELTERKKFEPRKLSNLVAAMVRNGIARRAGPNPMAGKK